MLGNHTARSRARSTALGTAIALALASEAAAGDPTWQPTKEQLIELRGGAAYPPCEKPSYCAHGRIGRHFGFVYLAPLGRWVGAGVGYERAYFSYRLDGPSLTPAVGETSFVCGMLRVRPLRTRWLEGSLDFGLGFGRNETDDRDGLLGAGVHLGLGLGVRPLPALFLGPYAQWVTVLAGKQVSCNEIGCTVPRPAHRSFAAFGLAVSFAIPPKD